MQRTGYRHAQIGRFRSSKGTRRAYQRSFMTRPCWIDKDFHEREPAQGQNQLEEQYEFGIVIAKHR